MTETTRRSLSGSILLTLAVAGSWAANSATQGMFTPQQRAWWAFQPVKRPATPAFSNQKWVRNPIDAFILARLEAKGLRPNPPADRITLLRRVTFDLIGLPPSPEEADALLSDSSPDAYEKVVDRLLASTHYGERWARHWLDLARYAESEGFKSDETRPNAWRYRDYVIRSLNANKPYNRFVEEQIAGDELWPADTEARIATAFHRHYPDESNARNLMQRRQEILDDITDATGSVFLGLTYGCARCHNHKFDPILQADYFRLQAFFANTTADDEIPLLSGDAARRHRSRMAQWDEKTKGIRDEMAALVEPRKRKMIKELTDKYPPEVQAAIFKPSAERTPFEWMMYYKAKPYLVGDDDAAAKSLKGEARHRYQELESDLKKYASLNPGEMPAGLGMRDISAAAPDTYTLTLGVYDRKQEKVEPGFLSILDPNPAAITPGEKTTGRRTALARWITDPRHPLTARVMVNRLWHYHFGQGIVASPSDFGQMGQRPTHPELLDWLADEFVRTGWDMKAMHKLIVMSAAYQQSSAHSETSARLDARNRLLWRFPRERLEAEVIRDSALAVSGMLNRKAGGPSVMPELPSGMPTPRGGWRTSPDEADRNRRSVYIFVRRNARYPMLEVFDMPDTHESCGRRNQTTTAPQALALLNNRLTLAWAQSFAGRVLEEAGSDTRKQIETAYRLAYQRRPDASERDTVETFLVRQKEIIAERDAAGQKIAAPAELPAGVEREHAAALVDFCHTLLNSNEFVYRN